MISQLHHTLSAALTALGETPDQVAESLKVAGAYGCRRSWKSCPVANYLTKLAGKEITVGITDAGDDSLGLDGQVPVPEPVRDFIRRFDKQEAYSFLLPGDNS